MLTRLEADTRVQRGAQWLDTNMPGWERVLKLPELDLADGCACVLGQLEGDFTCSLDRIRRFRPSFIKERWAVAHGFYLHDVGDGEVIAPITEEGYRVLTEAWRAEVERRHPLPAEQIAWTHRERESVQS
jgi:hypothetical protein